MVTTLLRFALIAILSRLARPQVSRGFGRLARRAPTGSFIEALLLELSTSYSAEVVRVIADTLTVAIIEAGTYSIRLAQTLRLRPSPRS